jgi:hypothetical protein
VTEQFGEVHEQECWDYGLSGQWISSGVPGTRRIVSPKDWAIGAVQELIFATVCRTHVLSSGVSDVKWMRVCPAAPVIGPMTFA